MMAVKKRLLIIDANSLIHRAFHALPPLSTSRGEMVNAVYGFLLAFFKAIKDFQPDYIAAAFDFPAPTKREKKFKAYKAKRVKAPDELYAQMPKVKEFLSVFHVPVFEKEGFEADDIIGTLAKLAPRKQVHPPLETIIVSGDMDALQLAGKHTKVYTMRKGIQDTVLYDEKKVRERFAGLDPKRIADWKGLRGDPSDNIPGVAGIGEKTATTLLAKTGSLEALYKGLSKNTEISPRIKEKLLTEKEQAFLSRELATIDRSVPVELKLSDLAWKGFDKVEAENLLNAFEFRTLAAKLGELRGEKQPQELFVSKDDETRQKIDRLFQEGVFSQRIYELELELSRVLRDMEKTGILVDIPYLKKLQKELAKDLLSLEQDIHKAAGVAFSVGSPKQLSQILFEKLEISQKGLHKTPGGVVSTASSELEKIQDAHPMVNKVLSWRELSKILTTYAVPLANAADKHGRVHTSFDQLGAATGRLSSFNPNLQNIPLQGPLALKIRRAFVAQPGFQLVSFDYSQVELRIAAHMAEEKNMQEAFLEGKDIHRETAAKVFGIQESEVTPEMRFSAKALNFGILYGMGARGFAQSAGIPYEEAQDFIENYFVQFPGIARYMEETIAFAKEYGYVETLFGRKRFLPDVVSSTPHIRAAAERVAINTPIQGTAADIIKMAMVLLAKKLSLPARDASILLQIHDELLFEIQDGIVEQLSKEIQRLMEQVVSFKVPLAVNVKTGPNFADRIPLA